VVVVVVGGGGGGFTGADDAACTLGFGFAGSLLGTVGVAGRTGPGATLALVGRETGRIQLLVVSEVDRRTEVVVVSGVGSGDDGAALAEERSAGLAERPPSATDEDRARDGPDADAVTLAMTDDTANHATAVAVAVPSDQVVIASDRRTPRVCTVAAAWRAKRELSLDDGRSFAYSLVLA
jgi:hypothetical protein